MKAISGEELVAQFLVLTAPPPEFVDVFSSKFCPVERLTFAQGFLSTLIQGVAQHREASVALVIHVCEMLEQDPADYAEMVLGLYDDICDYLAAAELQSDQAVGAN